MLHTDRTQEFIALVKSDQGDYYLEQMEERFGADAFIEAIRAARDDLAEIGALARVENGFRCDAYSARKAVHMLSKIEGDGYNQMATIYSGSTDPQTQCLALRFLYHGADDSIQYLEPVLKESRDGSFVAAAIDCTSHLGIIGAPLLDSVIPHHRNQTSPVYGWIGTEETLIRTLGAIGGREPEKVVPLLMSHLGFEDGEQRRELRIPEGGSCRGSDGLDNARAALYSIQRLGRSAQPHVEGQLRQFKEFLGDRGWLDGPLAFALAAVTGETD